MFDWWLTLILGRDVVNPRMNERGAIWHVLYEPGQIIVAAGDTRRYHYLVELVGLAQKGALTDLYRRTRVQLSASRTAPPLDPGHNFSINRWSL